MTAPAPSTTGPVAPGFERADRFTTVAAELAAIHESAALVDRSARLRMLLAGPKAAETLTGIVTNDVLSLRPGLGQYAAALTAKGKIIADIRVFARADDLLLDTSEPAAAGFAAMLRKFVNPRLAKFVDVSAVLRTIGAFGPRAADAICNAVRADVSALAGLAPYHHLALELEGTPILVAFVPDLGVPGFDLFVPVETAAALWSRLAGAGALPAGRESAEIARIEAGRPLWGTDMDENTLAAEANLDVLGGISYTKGCYTGQETVARIHFRGHVNRSLRSVRSESPAPRGAVLFSAGGESCGDVRSSAVSPRLGPVGIAMVRREVLAGSEVTARWDGGECAVRVGGPGAA